MTLEEFRKLKHRDFANGAVLDEIEKVFEDRDRLEKLADARKDLLVIARRLSDELGDLLVETLRGGCQ